MQLELDVLPALVGAGIYTVYRFISSRLAQHEKRNGEGAGKKLDVEFTNINDESSLEVSCQPNPIEEVPEPAPEPLEEAVTEVAGALLNSADAACSKQGVSLRRVLALVGVVIALCVVGTRSRSPRLYSDSGMLRLLGYKMYGNSASPENEASSIARSHLSDKAQNDVGSRGAQTVQQLVEYNSHDHHNSVNASLCLSHKGLDMCPAKGFEFCLQDDVPITEDVSPKCLADTGEAPLNIKLTRTVMDQPSTYIKSAYFGTVYVGTPPLEMTVVFDTGSGHLLLPSMYCKSDTCKAHTRYRRSASETGRDVNFNGKTVPADVPRDSITVKFGTGEVTGVLVEDIVCLGGLIDEPVTAATRPKDDDPDNTADEEHQEEEGTGGQFASVAQQTNEGQQDASNEVDEAEANGDSKEEEPFYWPENTSWEERVAGSTWASPEGLEPGCVMLRFLAATALSEDPFINFNFDGVLGMGLQGLSQTPEFNFMGIISQMLPDHGCRRSNTFGVFLADSVIEDSEIALGGWNQGHVSEELSWAPVHDQEIGHWIVNIRSLHVGNQKLDFCDDGTCKAAVDTGTALLAVPPKIFRELFEELRHSPPPSGHCQGVGPQLHIELEHFTVTLGPKEYSQVRKTNRTYAPAYRLPDDEDLNSTMHHRKTRTDLRCFPLLMTLQMPEPLGPKLFILGEPVLRKYYSVYDGERKRVGFGRALHRPFPNREQLLTMAPELDGTVAKRVGSSGKGRRRLPTMFDVFRWRSQLMPRWQ